MYTKTGLITHKFSKNSKRVLIAAGSPVSAFSQVDFELENSVFNINAEVSNVNSRKINKAKQLAKFGSIAKDVFKSSYVLTISSFPSDVIAKRVALSLMAIAFSVYKRGNSTINNVVRYPPYWYRIYNSYRNPLIEDKVDTCFLVLSGVTSDSTQLKRDKLRDILDLYDDIPRIVITAPKNPIEFAADTHYHSNAFLYLGPCDTDLLVV